jgi:hypothetical protein
MPPVRLLSKRDTHPCTACFRPCEDKDAAYCNECLKSDAAAWHADMIARWRLEVEEKENQ